MAIKRKEITFLDYTGYEKFLHTFRSERRKGMHDLQYVFKFPNGYGASVIKSALTAGHEVNLWEVAVLHFDKKTGEYTITYRTPVADDVIAYCPDSKVRIILGDIKALKRIRK